MIDIHCPRCLEVLGQSKRSAKELEDDFAASLRAGRYPTEQDYDRSWAIVAEQNRMRDVVLDHLKAVHPDVYYGTFPLAAPQEDL
jgi:hypothetical protein